MVQAAAGGLLDESHWIDLKRELPPGKRTHNTELAQDLASLAIDGGLLVIGIEDRNSYAGRVCGVALAGLADRVDQVARDKVRPSLVVRSREVHDPAREDWGCLLVHVPPSALAPHMVDYVYYGRGDRANVRLGDEEVRRIIEARQLGRVDVAVELRGLADDDPIKADERLNGHLYVIAQPEFSSEEMFLDLLTRDDGISNVQDVLTQVRAEQTEQFEPGTQYLRHQIQRADGIALTSYHPEDGADKEYALVELLLREDGGIRLICGRGAEPVRRGGFWPEDKPQMGIIVLLVLGLTRSVAALAGRLADEFGSYQGRWHLGVRMDRLLNVVPYDAIHSPFWPGYGYNRNEYEKFTTAPTEEMVNAPHAVAERLLAQLIRGLRVSEKYLPYKP